jgi:hypothetical protein
VERENKIIIEVYGEGRTDVGMDVRPEHPHRGVLPILLHSLCGRPNAMRVKCYGRPFLGQKGSLLQKVRFARRQSYYNRSNGAVFVVDSEGTFTEKNRELHKGRDLGPSGLPMAVGVAHPCIESWLLADAAAVRQGLKLSAVPSLPDKPEELPPPNKDRQRNPKTILAAIGGAQRQELSAADKDNIARNITDFNLVRARCPMSFAPFADEVETYIHPLFQAAAALTPGPSPASGRGE